DNTANVSGSPETNTGNNSSEDTIDVLCPDVSVAKAAFDAEINAGENAQYTITVTAGGTGDSTNVVLTDTVPGPAALSWDVGGADAAACAPDPVAGGALLTCNFGTASPGTEFVVTLTAAIPGDGSVCADLSNTATVSSDNDTVPGNNSAGPVVIDVNCPTVSILKEANETSVSAGEPISFDITVTVGGEGSTVVTLNDTVPSNVAGNWVVSGTDAAACNSPVAPGGALTCNFGTVTAPDTLEITLTATTNSGSCPEVENTATVTGTPDAETANNNSSTASVVVNCPDVSVTKTPTEGTIDAGDTAEFSIVVSNSGDAGTGTAFNVSVDDTLNIFGGAVSWTLTSVTPGTGVTCTGITLPGPDPIPGGVLDCNIDELAPGDSVTFVVTSSAIPNTEATCAGIPNTVLVDAENELEADNENNTATANIVVNCGEITIDKTADTGPFSAGDEVGFTIVVNVGGTGTVTGIALTDLLPANTGLEWQLGTFSGWDTCAVTGAPGTQELNCEQDSVEAPASFSVRVFSDTTEETC
ncbi:MAG: hypothetical protein ACREF4_20270, partial [Gammaproteobacteria bacterium]